MPRKRTRAWVWLAVAALLVLAPAGWLGAEYALDLDEMEGVRAQVDGVRELLDRTATEPSDSGESAACDRAGERLAALAAAPWWRHVAFTLLEEQQVQDASARLAAMRQVAAERRANRAWWVEQAAAIDAALAAEDRTIPDIFALRDRVESSQPPHPDAGGLAPDARPAAMARIEADAATLTATQDSLLGEFVAAAERVARATDAAALDEALASAPGPDARDLNPPELDMVRERLNARAEAIRSELALRVALEASVAAALSKVLALDPESAATGDAAAVVTSIEAVAVPEGARYAGLAESKSQALEAAQRRVALLESRDRDRAWLAEIAAAAPSATTARDAQALLARLLEPPPGGCGLESVVQRAREIQASLKARLQARRDLSRRWREDLAGAVDAMVASRDLEAYAASSGRVDDLLALGTSDPSSSEDAQAERAAQHAQRATASRLVRQELAPVLDAVRQMADPRRPPPEVLAALSPDSTLASVAEAQATLSAIRKALEDRLAEYEAFDGAIDRTRRAMESGDLCAAAEALAGAAPRNAEQEWIRTDMRGALGELAVESVESMVLGGGSMGPGAIGRLEQLATCPALEASAPDAALMARRVWDEVRVEADRALWEDCRSVARDAIERRDAATFTGALNRYLARPGAMRAAAEAASAAFAVPVASVIASEFRWGGGTCAAADAIADIAITVDGETWSGPIPTGGPRRIARLSHEWMVRSGADAVLLSASGVCPCEEPQPFAGIGELTLNDRRFGALLAIPCPPLGTGMSEGAHDLMLKVAPSAGWLAALRLPAWRPADETAMPARPADSDSEGGADAQAETPPRPESDEPAFREPTPEEAPR